AAIVHAARLFEGITQVQLKQTVVVLGEGPDQLVPIDYGEITMREDTPRNASGVADLRYRAQYWPWSAVLRVRTIGGQFDRSSILSLVDRSEEHTSELQSRENLVCRLLLEKKKR